MNEENAFDLLEVATFYQFEKLICHCESYIKVFYFFFFLFFFSLFFFLLFFLFFFLFYFLLILLLNTYKNKQRKTLTQKMCVKWFKMLTGSLQINWRTTVPCILSKTTKRLLNHQPTWPSQDTYWTLSSNSLHFFFQFTELDFCNLEWNNYCRTLSKTTHKNNT